MYVCMYVCMCIYIIYTYIYIYIYIMYTYSQHVYINIYTAQLLLYIRAFATHDFGVFTADHLVP